MKKILLYSNIILLLTSLHHIYGAIIYKTPERYHILFLSIPVVAFNIYMYFKATASKILPQIHQAITFIVPIMLIGLFEGVYNHGLKNVMFFLGAPDEIMMHMFPPPVYVMPNDFVFEFTGILQAVLVFPLLSHWHSKLKNHICN